MKRKEENKRKFIPKRFRNTKQEYIKKQFVFTVSWKASY